MTTSLHLIKNTKPESSVDEAVDERDRMVREQMSERDIANPRVLTAMRAVPRHRFVPKALRTSAHLDRPLPIGCDQTISQPYIVALMTSMLTQLLPKEGTVLEIGSGCGYQTAILVSLGYEVHCVEIVPELLDESRIILKELGLEPASFNLADGHLGLVEQAPFDGILAAACAKRLPRQWRLQLKQGGVIVAPINRLGGQHLYRWQKKGRIVKREHITAVRFVPLVKR